MHQYTDQQLVCLIKTGNRAAFNYLYANYSTAILLTIYRITGDKHTSEDILQETFINIWAHIHQYDAKKGALYTWIRTIAKNKALDFINCGANNMRRRTEKNEDKLYTIALNTEHKIDQIGLSARVNNLSPQHKNLICLVYYNGHTFEEIANLLNIPLGTIKTRMRRALGLLRDDFRYAI